MEMTPKRYETVADIPADEFLPLQKNTEEEREQITAPSFLKILLSMYFSYLY